jgi:phosphoglycolate phosphatase
MNAFSHILFDLDGTLTDPKVGILGSIAHAMERLGRPLPDADLTWCIGPPLHESFARLLDSFDDDLLRSAIGFYRERFAVTGKFENTIYPGIPEMLADLVENGYVLLVATSKPTIFAGEIVEHFGLGSYFSDVYGSRLDGGLSDKGELIAHIIADRDLDPLDMLMIGDRRHDISGGLRNGVRAAGVAYGYGTIDELSTAGADPIFASPTDIARYLIRKSR